MCSFGWGVLPLVPEQASSGSARAVEPSHCCRGSLIIRQVATWCTSSSVWVLLGCDAAGEVALQVIQEWTARGAVLYPTGWSVQKSLPASGEDGAFLCSVRPAGNPLLEVEITPGFSDRETVPLQDTVWATYLPKCLRVFNSISRWFLCSPRNTYVYRVVPCFCVRCI